MYFSLDFPTKTNRIEIKEDSILFHGIDICADFYFVRRFEWMFAVHNFQYVEWFHHNEIGFIRWQRVNCTNSISALPLRMHQMFNFYTGIFVRGSSADSPVQVTRSCGMYGNAHNTKIEKQEQWRETKNAKSNTTNEWSNLSALRLASGNLKAYMAVRKAFSLF